MPSAKDTAASEARRSYDNAWEVFQQRSTGHSTSERTSAWRCSPLPGPERPAVAMLTNLRPDRAAGTHQVRAVCVALGGAPGGSPRRESLGRHSGYRLWQRMGCEGPEARNSKRQRTRPELQKKASSRWTQDLYWKLWITATRTSHCGLLGRERHDRFCISKRSFFGASSIDRREKMRGRGGANLGDECGDQEKKVGIRIYLPLTGTGDGRREGERSVTWLGLCPGWPDKQCNGAQGGGREQSDDLPVLDAKHLKVSETPTQSPGKRASACIWSPRNGWDWAFRFGNQHTDGTPRTLKEGSIS